MENITEAGIQKTSPVMHQISKKEYIRLLKDEVKKEFSRDLSNYLSSSQARTQETLGKILGYSARHIGRMKQGTHLPTTEALKVFYKMYYKESTFSKAVKRLGPDSAIRKFITILDPSMSYEIDRNYIEEVDTFLRENVDYAALFMIITENKNITVSEITKINPLNGADAIEEMLKRKIINVRENGTIEPVVREVQFSDKTVLYVVKNMSRYINPTKLRNHLAAASATYGNLTFNEVQEALLIQAEADNKMIQLFQRSKGNGSHILVSGMYITTLGIIEEEELK